MTRSEPRCPVIPSRWLLLPGALLLLGLLPAPVRAQTPTGRRTAVVHFDGAGAQQARAAVLEQLAGTHTAIPSVLVDQKAAQRAVEAGCPDPTKVQDLARSLEAEAVVCGAVEGLPWKRQLKLTVYNGNDGSRLGDLAVPMKGGKLQGGLPEGSAAQLLELVGRTTVTSPGQAAAKPGDPSVLPQVLDRLREPDAAARKLAVSDLAHYTQWQAMMPMSCVLLTDPADGVRKLAAEKMAKMHDAAIVQGLIAASGLEGDRAVKAQVGQSLQQLKSTSEALQQQLASNITDQRRQAARALGQAGYPGTAAALARATKDIDAEVRMRAVEGLRHFPNVPAARRALAEAAKDGNEVVRKAATTIIGEQQRLAAWRAFYISYMRVVKKTQSSDPSWREEAALALGVSTAESAAPRLISLLQNDGNPEVRIAAAWALVLIGGGGQAESALKAAAAGDRDPAVQRMVKSFLGAAQTDPAALARDLANPSTAARRVAAMTLALRAGTGQIAHFLRSAMCDRDPYVRKAVLLALGRTGHDLGIKAIRLAMARDADEEVRRLAMMVYVLVGWEDAPEFAPTTKATKETAAWDAKDTEDPLEQEQRRREAEAAARRKAQKKVEKEKEWCPLGCKAFVVRLGPASLFLRNYGVTPGDDGDEIDEQGITTTPVAGIDVGGEIYPATFFTRGWLSLFGMAFHYTHYFGLSWKVAQPSGALIDTTDDSVGITHQRVSVDFLRVRFQPVRSQRVPTLIPRFGLRYLQFAMNDEQGDRGFGASHIPDVSITALAVGLLVDLPVTTVKARVGFDYLAVTSWGEITERSIRDEEDKAYVDLAGFGEGSGWGFAVTAGLRGWFTSYLGWELDLDFARYMLSFDGNGGRKAESAADQYFSGRAYLTFGF